MQTSCSFSRDHANRAVVAILAYRFSGAKRRNLYPVCLPCYGEANRENLVDVKFIKAAPSDDEVATARTLAGLEASYAARYARTPMASWDSFEQNATEQGLAVGSVEWLREILAEADAEGVA